MAHSRCGFHTLLDLFPAVSCVIVSFLQTPRELELSRNSSYVSSQSPFVFREKGKEVESKGPQNLGLASCMKRPVWTWQI